MSGSPRFLPTWAAFVVLSLVFVGTGWLLLRPDQPTCEFNQLACTVDQLHDADLDSLLTPDDLQRFVDRNAD